jgi:branched-chain amino acid transport system substrate-binding protein
MNKKTLSILIILVLALGAFVVTAQDGEPIKVGAIFDLSGATGDVGTPYGEGVIAYVDWRNSNGGINGRPIELLSQDYTYSVETAENLYTEFVGEGVVVFMGWGTGDSEALRTRVTEDEIPFISASYSGNLNDPMGEAPYNFLIAPTYNDQLTIMMTYMLAEWTDAGNAAEDMNVVLFHNDSPFGTAPIPDGEAFAEAYGVGFSAVPMPRGATDFTAELQQADDAGVTHIVVQNVSSPAALLASNTVDFFGGIGSDFVEFGCLNWCADELFVRLAVDAAEGVLGAIPFTPTTVEVPGQETPREYLGGQEELEAASLHFTQGWTAMSIMAEAIGRTLDAGLDLTGPNIKATLETFSEDPFDTGDITAPISFTAEDHRASRALHIFTVEMGAWVEASDLIDLRAMEGE